MKTKSYTPSNQVLLYMGIIGALSFIIEDLMMEGLLPITAKLSPWSVLLFDAFALYTISLFLLKLGNLFVFQRLPSIDITSWALFPPLAGIIFDLIGINFGIDLSTFSFWNSILISAVSGFVLTIIFAKTIPKRAA